MQFHDTEPIPAEKLWQFVGKKLGSKPKTIESPKMWASYHKIYIIKDASNKTFYLRVARPALPRAKTLNEVACIKWVRERCPNCPCPEIIAYSVEHDEIGYEYVIIEGLPGDDLIKLKDANLERVVDQCVDFFIEIAKHSLDKVGGLTIENGDIIPGPVIEEVGYELDEVFGEFSYGQLQIGGPFDSMRDYIEARLKRDLMIIKSRNDLDKVGKKIEKVLERIPDIVNTKRLALAHQDLHQGNMLYTDKLSGVVDWELACAMPIDQWVKRNTFATNDPTQMDKIPKLKERFFNKLKEKDEKLWTEVQPEPVKDELVTIISLTFWIVKCTVTGTQANDIINWKSRLDDTINIYQRLIENL